MRKGQTMKISMEEVGNILRTQQAGGVAGNASNLKTGVAVAQVSDQHPAASVELSSRAQEIQLAKQVVNNSPDTREELVQSLKSQIDNGTYHVTGGEIADLIMRRAYADRIR